MRAAGPAAAAVPGARGGVWGKPPAAAGNGGGAGPEPPVTAGPGWVRRPSWAAGRVGSAGSRARSGRPSGASGGARRPDLGACLGAFPRDACFKTCQQGLVRVRVRGRCRRVLLPLTGIGDRHRRACALPGSSRRGLCPCV